MMAWLTPAGILGAVVGSVVGWLNYKIVTGFVTQKLREFDRSATPAEKAEFEGKLVLLKRIVLIGTVPVIGTVGYWFGRTLGG
ncbi:hypothetical protein E8L99_18925 [Phreatobacter aquaticus]|uniref:Uncharacterized protein n=1 Tax=Phreatobacter aquaticus TaxID=2570229 RepID=A0A4D7QMD7_9HYPH|nr:hypothetical protein [Phreatobacter aquaticus]QCK87681.1 hypothetical protein E8L99_18925 [Phreatobacter aquaticus]